ncbi:hypothetical protein ASC95_08490 [Pelomonas sp. Root1217]|uniref:hypothetical protein n=1 Tax=Pelomonas sp. Root1217 TaxID=1736430 RepID=UPI00070EF030|nr:hypothetical protein [Pelomonas sp. Root1217]KQV52833.1 hypothetical protein ASC95_08490 [Pelomonas sp. Root1217]
MNISPINAESQREPLCRSYVCAVFDVLRLQIQSEAGPRPVQLLWAVGVLSDHLPHYLGTWLLHDPEGAWRAIADDLHDRGIDRLRIVFAPDPVEAQADLARHYRNLTVLPTPVEAVIDSTLSGHGQYMKRALEVANPLSLRLKRAVARHGPFAEAAAAAELLRRSASSYIYASWTDHLEPPMRVRCATASWPPAATDG